MSETGDMGLLACLADTFIELLLKRHLDPDQDDFCVLLLFLRFLMSILTEVWQRA